MLPWRVNRVLKLLAINNVRYILYALRNVGRSYDFSVVISTRFFGGVGGTEKLLQSVVDSMPNVFFNIYAEELRLEGFKPSGANYIVNAPKAKGAKFDIYLYFCGGGKPPFLGDLFDFKVSVVDTNAANIDDIVDRFEYVAIQSTMFDVLCEKHKKCIYAFPNVNVTLPKRVKKVPYLPPEYLVTVFNPFSKAQKGHDILERVAKSSRLPIVWCYSDMSEWDFSQLPEIENVLRLENLTQEELYYIYKNARAYVHFARYESFGWTLAEAFYQGIPIVARDTGIISFIKDQRGIYIYASEGELLDLLSRDLDRDTQYDYSWLDDNSYGNVFERLVRGVPPNTPRSRGISENIPKVARI